MTTSRSKEWHQFGPTTQAVRTFTSRGYFCAYNRSLSRSSLWRSNSSVISALSRQVKQSNRAFSGSAMLYVPYTCFRADGVGGGNALHDAVEQNHERRSLRSCPSCLRLQISAPSLRQNLQGWGWITEQDSLIAVFSRISACIDFSFDLWCLKGIVSRRSSTLSTKPADEVEIQAR